MRRLTYIYIVSTFLMIILFAASLLIGSVKIPPTDALRILLFQGADEPANWSMIMLHSRLPQTITALLSGAALAVSGLMLQTLFSNPLASPSILGISSGSGVGVALAVMVVGGRVNSVAFGGNLAIVAGAMIGALAVLGLLLLFSTLVRGNVMLLIAGMMVSYIATSITSLLSFYSTSDGVVSYVVWGMGDFTGVSSDNIAYYGLFIIAGLLMSVLMIKPLNALLLGQRYSQNLGINTKRARIFVLLATGLLTAVVTAFCGPIAFIGMAVPHVARMVTRTSNHRQLLPVTIILGAVVALLCNILTSAAGSGIIIPLNVITPLMGAPIIIYIITNKKRMAYFS